MLLATGERSIAIKRAINNKLGLTRADDKLPKICLEVLKEGSSADKLPDMELMLREYYARADLVAGNMALITSRIWS